MSQRGVSAYSDWAAEAIDFPEYVSYFNEVALRAPFFRLKIS
jgi:hypothetical protein